MMTQTFQRMKCNLKGHQRSTIYLKIYFFLDIFFIQTQILSKLYMNDNIMKTQIFYRMMYGLKGYRRSHKVFLCLKL